MGEMTPVLDEFKKCLNDMSYSRAGWDYQLPHTQRAAEATVEKSALVRAREIWAENPEMHEQFRVAFTEVSPLATMSEIARQSATTVPQGGKE